MWSNNADLPKATNPAERRRNIENASKMMSEYNNPCIKEQKISLKCLSDNNYDNEKCLSAFENYKACKEFWFKVQNDRRRKGIKPPLPRPEERDQIKEEYMKKMHGNR